MVKIPITYFLNFEAPENSDGWGLKAREELEFEVKWMGYFLEEFFEIVEGELIGNSWNWAKDNFGVFLETFNEIVRSDLQAFGFAAQENLKLKCVHIVNFVFQELKAPVKKRDGWWDEYGWMLKQFSTNFFKCLAMPAPSPTP